MGDGEAETGPLATAWHSNKFVNPARDGTVLPIPIPNLNGYTIANPTILARISHEEPQALFRGYGYTPYFVEGDDPSVMHQKMAGTLDEVVAEIRGIWKSARQGGRNVARPRCSMIVLRTPKGWTGPKVVKGKKAEGSWRSHQVPFSDVRSNPESLRLLERMTGFRVFGPDETASNRLQAIYEVSKKTWMADLLPEGVDGGELSRDGRVMEMLSEHTLLGWLEGYLLTGRHELFHTCEAFADVVDSMFNQRAKWLDISKNHAPWRAPVASQNILLSSTLRRQDHNGFSHQDRVSSTSSSTRVRPY